MKKIKVSLDKQKFEQKPDKQDAKSITNRIASNTIELSVDDLKDSLVQPNGQSFCPAVFSDGKRRNDHWISQQIFGLDFDDGIAIEQVLERCEKYNVKPAIIYTTFSSVNNNKFRVLFQCETKITDQRLAKVIQLSLMRMFPESDKACKDSSRIFYGGQAAHTCDNEAVFCPPLLVQTVCRYITDEDKAHASRNIQQWCQFVGLDMFNGLPKVLLIDEDVEEENAKIGEIATSPIYIYTYSTCSEITKKYGFYFCQNNTKEITGRVKYSVVNEKVERTELIRDFDFDALQDSCELYRDFLEQDYKLEHNERLGIATNLCCIMGGQKKFIDACEFGNTKVNDRYDLNEWQYQLNYLNKMNYAPMRCDKFCPYANGGCEHAKNMIDQVKLLRGTVRVLRNPEYKTLEQAEKELQEQFNRALLEDTNKIYVIKASTGIGKTKLYESLYNVTIALPTHKLKEEVSKRMKTPFQMTPEMPEDSFLEKLYNTGSYFLARKYIEQQAKAGNEQSEEFKEYLKEDTYACKSCGNLLTTHAKLLSLKRYGTIIIDEDITSTLYPIATTTMDDLKIMAESCGNDKRDTLISLYHMVESAGVNIVYDMPSYGGIKTSRLENNILASTVNSNVLGFLNCSHYTKSKDSNGKEYITYITKRELPEKQKIIMLSATANEEICRMMFGDRLEFIDIGNVITIGEIEQYPQRSFSRYSLGQELIGDDLVKIAKELTHDYKVITYKDHEKKFNAIAHFGATEGIDEWSGQNIAIVGTPHNNPVKYILLANALGKRPKLNDTRTSMNYSKVKRNGMEFYFQTFSKDETLQEIQLYIIESEMEQAVGRARILRNNCKVLVLSNYPLVGAEFKYLTKEQVLQLLAS